MWRAAIFLLLVLSGCAVKEPVQPLPNDAYVWQRRWNEPLLAALTQSASSIRLWRVLAAEAGGKTDLIQISIDRQALHKLAKPVIAVVRVDGHSRATLLGDQLAAQIVALAPNWKTDGVPVRGIEIDYDCATDRLPQYRDFLHLLRARIPPDMALSITALPSWMERDDLPKLLAEVDETVLQIHSVVNAKKGLFDRSTALKWAHDWSKVSSVPFRLALPTYWSRVTWNEDGRVVSIESEVTRRGTDPHGTDQAARELLVDPNDVASLIADLRRARPRNLVGIAWFRLPIATDRRTWSTQTWHAVMQGQPLRAALPVVHFKTDQTGATNVYLRNEGELDAKLPSQVSISGQGCEFADSMPPYNLDRQANVVKFLLTSDDLLRSSEERLIGWIRCSSAKLEAHVSF